MIYNGAYKNEETAAHASDTLARSFIENGEQNHKLNFNDNGTEVCAKKQISKYTGVSYHESKAKWVATRRCKDKKKTIYNGTYNKEETAAHASDTLVRILIANGEQNQRLNFPDDETEVYPEKKISKYIGVYYNKRKANNVTNWEAKRWSKKEWKMVHNGNYKDEETAAHVSDTLARELMANGEKNHKLNFPDYEADVYPDKRKRFEKFRNM